MELDAIETENGETLLIFTIKDNEIQNLLNEAELAGLEVFVYEGIEMYELEINGVELHFYNYQKLEKEINRKDSKNLEDLK